MATILSQYTTTGFYNAPVSKGLMGYMFLTCTALNVPLLAHLKKYLICKVPGDIFNGEVWRIATSKMAFVDTKDLVCGSLLIYYFRVFERRYGSHKFASSLVATQVITTFLELLMVAFLQWLNMDIHPEGLLPPGPYGVIFPLFVNYFFDIPRVSQTNILGIPISGKTLTYLIGLQVCWPSYPTLLSAICGVVSGLIYRYSIGCIRNFPWVPSWLSKAAEATLKKLLASSSPPEGPVGATLELQRQEQMELLEQQMILNRAREYRDRTAVNGGLARYMPNMMNERPDPEPDIQPSDENVEMLVEMGFERQRVLNALMSCNNDINIATLALLQET